MMSEPGEKYWYNMATGEVEFGRLSPAVDRAGPFDTEDEARHAMDTIHENARKWAEDDEADR